VRGLDHSRPIEVHSLRPALGTDPHGRPRLSWVVELTQSEGHWLDENDRRGTPDYVFRNGTTLIIDAITGKVRYSIGKADTRERRERQRAFNLDDGSDSLAATYFGAPGSRHAEPFALLHRR
jgi:hypothetical protein